jgi:hypothetical protein
LQLESLALLRSLAIQVIEYIVPLIDFLSVTYFVTNTNAFLEENVDLDVLLEGLQLGV